MEIRKETSKPSERIRKKIKKFQKAEEVLEKNRKRVGELTKLALKKTNKEEITKGLKEIRKELSSLIKTLIKEIKNEKIRSQLRFNLNWISKEYSEKTYNDLWSACIETSLPMDLMLFETIKTEIKILETLIEEIETSETNPKNKETPIEEVRELFMEKVNKWMENERLSFNTSEMIRGRANEVLLQFLKT